MTVVIVCAFCICDKIIKSKFVKFETEYLVMWYDKYF